MADVFTKKKRSEVMSKIKSGNTKPEMIVRSFLFQNGFRYRLHQKDLPGRPDIVLRKYKTVIFVQGCFWHGHTAEKCKIVRTPKSNISFWTNKINTNKTRDARNLRALKKLGWTVHFIWECDLRSKKRDKILITLVNKIIGKNGRS
jgi:DNA mismatch endonuclease, patch repair protein